MLAFSRDDVVAGRRSRSEDRLRDEVRQPIENPIRRASQAQQYDSEVGTSSLAREADRREYLAYGGA